MSCLEHTGHLSVKTSMKLSDHILRTEFDQQSFTYFSALAKLINIWTDFGRAIYTTWVLLYGALEALRWARTAPPRCISGRWGSGIQAEGRVGGTPQDQAATVFDTVSRATTKGRRAEREAGRAPELDAFRHDEAAAYTARQSKWWRDVLQAIRCEAWWVTVCLLLTFAYLTTYVPTYHHYPPTYLPTYLT